MRSLRTNLNRHRVWLGGLVAATALAACGLEDDAAQSQDTEEQMTEEMTEEEMTEDMDDDG